MDTGNIIALATAMSQQRTDAAASVAVLKKAINIQAEGAAQLVQAAVQSMQAYNNPPHLGNRIDTFA